ncbi:MaoC family dehydratase N-terminal domain-containing protein [Nocardia yamanashiensis]|uniref:MaoC/PaaZ C-terminal domain-containing protein n=1 Tax=Nocardia yamanashiensis TaxID=209247 RepID=UPI001E4119DA|nr:MaoC/PaaZ C-terminal domain-containing protein [Nocardia yamanashiensis]UGT38847.1 MaoC family dehydratase N-terminal domain-containing protein [Nocardia yamanashiensis]
MTRAASRVAKFDTDAVGVWGDTETFEVTQERISAYAEASNDPIPAHLSGEVAPPVFAIVPVMPALFQAAFMVAPFDVAINALHGMQDFRYVRPIVPGDVITTRMKPIGFTGKPNGTAAPFYIECRDAAGELVNEQYLTMFINRVDAGESVGETAPGHAFDEALRDTEPVAVVTAHMDEDQTFRYGPAAGDPMPQHTEEEAAKAAGLPGIIIHGLCTQAFISWALLTEVADSRTERLKRFALRFNKPVLPGQDITTTIWKAGAADGVTTYVFETTVDGEVVIRDGLAEITD